MAYLRSLRLTSRISSNFNRLRSISTISYSEEVNQARLEQKPLVALESTIITHGMPFPQNLETAMQVENVIRQRGAVPATVAVLKGQLTVGLSEAQLRYLAQAPGVVKTSRRDLAPVAAAQLDGATTVAGTIEAADLAGIPVFVTGGIGGVHREGESTLDISADLNELGRSRTLVVCSGVKSILDIGRTLEYLETQGVCVCAFGETDHFPAFYTRRSGHHAPYHVTDAYHAARVLHSAHRLQLTSGIVVAVPVPEEHAMNEKIIEAAIEQALMEAKKNGIKGKEVTPFLLAAVADATKGASLAANIALIKNNAKVGADIAIEFNKLQKGNNLNISKNIEFSNSARKCKPNFPREFHTSIAFKDSENDDGSRDMPIFFNNTHSNGDVLVIGGANVDRTYRVTEDDIQLDGSTHGCAVGQCGGGVGRNMAEALWRLRESGAGASAGGGVRLLTALGDDADGRYLQHIQPGLLLDGCVVKDGRTASYAAVLDAKGECKLGLGDMQLHDHITIELVEKNIEVLNKAPLVVIDGNPPQATIEHVLRRCHELRKPVFFEPTDRRKAIKALQSEHDPNYASPNVAELRQMANFLQQHNVNRNPDFTEIIELCKIVSQRINHLVVTLGEKGVLIFHREKCKHTVRLYPVEILEHVKNVSGAGDCFASGFIHGMLLGLKESNCVSLGSQAARCALFSNNSVPTYFNFLFSH